MNPHGSLIEQLSQELKIRKWKLVTAESCTGGGIAFYLTEIPGSSTWFERGFITYSNRAKEELLGVKPATLKKWGAVSEETALEMALGAIENSDANISVSVTGIAGPSGGSIEKPVGTVWFGCANKEKKIQVSKAMLTGNRQEVREQAIQLALAKVVDFLRQHSL